MSRTDIGTEQTGQTRSNPAPMLRSRRNKPPINWNSWSSINNAGVHRLLIEGVSLLVRKPPKRATPARHWRTWYATGVVLLMLPMVAFLLIPLQRFGHNPFGWFWVAFPLYIISMIPMRIGAQLHGRRFKRTQGLYLTEKQAWLLAGSAIVLSMAGSVVLLLLFPEWISFLLGPGLLLFMIGWTRRGGPLRRCRECDYEYSWSSEDEAAGRAPSNCPECGSEWREFLVRGSRIRSKPLMAVGAAVAVLGLFGFPGLGRATHAYAILPTWILINHVTDHSAIGHTGEWATLQSRTLTPKQRERLARGLLERRSSATWFLGPEGETWIQQAIKSGLIPIPLVDRYFSEALKVQIIAPDSVRVGERFKVALRVENHGDIHNGVGPRVWFVGYGVDDGTPLVGRLGGMQYGNMFGSERITFGRVGGYSIRGSNPEATLSIDKAGSTTIRAVYWLVFPPIPSPGTPAGTVPNVGWNPDGSPALPKGSAGWLKRIEVTRTIEVVAGKE